MPKSKILEIGKLLERRVAKSAAVEPIWECLILGHLLLGRNCVQNTGHHLSSTQLGIEILGVLCRGRSGITGMGEAVVR
jgi:hypothetical protein